MNNIKNQVASSLPLYLSLKMFSCPIRRRNLYNYWDLAAQRTSAHPSFQAHYRHFGALPPPPPPSQLCCSSFQIIREIPSHPSLSNTPGQFDYYLLGTARATKAEVDRDWNIHCTVHCTVYTMLTGLILCQWWNGKKKGAGKMQCSGSGLDPDPGGQKDLQKIGKKLLNLIFWIAGCSLFWGLKASTIAWTTFKKA